MNDESILESKINSLKTRESYFTQALTRARSLREQIAIRMELAQVKQSISEIQDYLDSREDNS